MSGAGLFVPVALVILEWKEEGLFALLDALLLLVLQLPKTFLGCRQFFGDGTCKFWT